MRGKRGTTTPHFEEAFARSWRALLSMALPPWEPTAFMVSANMATTNTAKKTDDEWSCCWLCISIVGALLTSLHFFTLSLSQ